MASQVFDEPEQGRTESLRLRLSRMSLSMRQRPRRALREAGEDIETTKTIGLVPAATTQVGASIKRIRIRRSDHRPGGIEGRARPPRRPWDLGWRRSRA